MGVWKHFRSESFVRSLWFGFSRKEHAFYQFTPVIRFRLQWSAALYLICWYMCPNSNCYTCWQQQGLLEFGYNGSPFKSQHGISWPDYSLERLHAEFLEQFSLVCLEAHFRTSIQCEAKWASRTSIYIICIGVKIEFCNSRWSVKWEMSWVSYWAILVIYKLMHFQLIIFITA